MKITEHTKSVIHDKDAKHILRTLYAKGWMSVNELAVETLLMRHRVYSITRELFKQTSMLRRRRVKESDRSYYMYNLSVRAEIELEMEDDNQQEAL